MSMSPEQIPVQYLKAMLTGKKIKKLIARTNNFTETYTPSNATTVDRLLTEVGEPVLRTLVDYLRKWQCEDAVIEVDFTKEAGGLPFYVIWHEGVWHDGIWLGGEWKTGIWNNGVWVNGIWQDGIWKNGVWENGVWKGGTWMGGVWKGGVYAPEPSRTYGPRGKLREKALRR